MSVWTFGPSSGAISKCHDQPWPRASGFASISLQSVLRDSWVVALNARWYSFNEDADNSATPINGAFSVGIFAFKEGFGFSAGDCQLELDSVRDFTADTGVVRQEQRIVLDAPLFVEKGQHLGVFVKGDHKRGVNLQEQQHGQEVPCGDYKMSNSLVCSDFRALQDCLAGKQFGVKQGGTPMIRWQLQSEPKPVALGPVEEAVAEPEIVDGNRLRDLWTQFDKLPRSVELFVRDVAGHYRTPPKGYVNPKLDEIPEFKRENFEGALGSDASAAAKALNNMKKYFITMKHRETSAYHASMYDYAGCAAQAAKLQEEAEEAKINLKIAITELDIAMERPEDTEELGTAMQPVSSEVLDSLAHGLLDNLDRGSLK